MKIIAKNKRARFDYEIVDTLIAGLVLEGSEVKSIKDGAVSLKGSYIRFVNAEPVITGMHVSHYKPATAQHEVERDRKLLLHKSEIDRLIGMKQNGMHIIPLALGTTRNLVKMEIGIGRSRKKHDKRERIKQRDSARQIARRLQSK